MPKFSSELSKFLKPGTDTILFLQERHDLIEVVACALNVGIEAQRFSEMDSCFFEPSGTSEGNSEVVVRTRKFWV